MIPVAELAHHPAHLFSGLGNNQFFFQQTAALIQKKCNETAFADHYAYQKADLEKILANLGAANKNKAKFDGTLILTTEKDYFRLKSMSWMGDFSNYPFYYLKVALVPVAGWEALQERIDEIIKKYGKDK